MSIASPASVARESAREPDGRFGEQSHAEPDVQLAAASGDAASTQIAETATEARPHVDAILASGRTAVVISRTRQQLVETDEGHTEAVAGNSYLEVHPCDGPDEVSDLVGSETAQEVGHDTDRILEDTEMGTDGSFESTCIDIHRPSSCGRR